MPGNTIFSMPIIITEEDIDIMQHVNNVIYLRWVQDVAIAHWLSITTPEQQRQWPWVVKRHEIDYLRPVVFGDKITAATSVIPPGPHGFDREVVFTNDDTGKVVCKAITTWQLIDPQTMRRTGLTREVLAVFGIDSES